MSMEASARASSAINEASPPPSHMTCSVCRAVYRSGFPRCPKDGGILTPFEVDPLEGSTFVDRYQIEAFVGEGAMGRVYRARHSRMSGRIFAVKVMFGDLAADHKMRSRFAHEAEASSRLNHPNLVSVVDFGETPDGLLYLVMDFIEGKNLADMLEGGRGLPEARVVQLLAGIAAGLEHAHEQGLIHRDLKTENVVVVNEGGREIPRVVDFGIAKLTEADSGEQKLTAQGCVVGTPAYMSPEQACGEPLDIRSDLFSLGLIVYELLAGRKPFDGSPMEVARQNISSNPPPLAARSPGVVVSPELEELVFKLLEKRPEDRPNRAAEIVARLEAIYGPDAIRTGGPMVARSVSKPDTQLGDDMLSALSSSASRFRTSASETIAMFERAGLGGHKRTVLAVAAVLLLFLVGVGLFRSLSSGGSDLAIAAEPLEVEPLAPTPVEPEKLAAAEETVPETDELGEGAEDDVVARPRDTKRPPTSGRKKAPPPVTPSSKKKSPERAEPREAAPVAAKVEAEDKGPPVSTSDFSRKYIRVGTMVDRLAREKGRSVAEPFSNRYIQINLTDSLRLDALRKKNMAELNRLESQIEAKLK